MPNDRVWTAKEDARYLNPIAGLPGYRHSIGLARHWHFLTVPFFLLNGVVFIALLFFTEQWKRLVPVSWQVLPDSWNVFGFLAHWISWQRPRSLQNAEAKLNGTLWRASINKFNPKKYYKQKDISPYFWVNGKIPDSDEWRNLAANNFKTYKLKVGGLVENSLELSLEDLKKIDLEQNITMHHCIQGWSGIAEWGSLPIKNLVELVKPHASVTTVVFYSFGEGMYGGTYYDTHSLDNCLKPESILAWEMNYRPLSATHGAPLRLRVENQLGYKMVKWISKIEFLDT